MAQPLVMEIDSKPVTGWRGPCLDPVAAQIAVLTRIDLASPGCLDWSTADGRIWRLEIAPHVRFWDGRQLSAIDLLGSWKAGSDHPLGWSLAPLLALDTRIEIKGPSRLIIRLACPLPDLPQRLTALWLWPKLGDGAKEICILPADRGVFIQLPVGGVGKTRNIVLLRTDSRQDGLHLWSAGLLDATAPTGHHANTVSKLRQSRDWREAWSEIVATLLINPRLEAKKSLEAISGCIDREALVAATGGMGDALADPFEAHLPPDARSNCAADGACPTVDFPEENIPLYYADFPPNKAVCGALAEQLKAVGFQCRPTPLDWAEYLTRMAKGDWTLLYALMPAPWSAEGALPSAILRMLPGRHDSAAKIAMFPEMARRIWEDEGSAIVLFSLRSGSLLRGDIGNSAFNRWGTLAPGDLLLRED